jgi:4-hydroxybenzoyl-CoA reductase subunit beta
MLRLSRFEYLSPESLPEAVDMLQEHGRDAVLMAGGTDLLVNIKHRLMTPKFVIGIRGLSGLAGIDFEGDGGLRIGAGVTLASVASDPGIQDRYPALSEAARLVSAPQVRSVATLGGNICLDARCNYYNQSYEWRKAIGFCMKKDSEICRVAPGGDRCWAVASADTVPVLIALGAEATVVGPAGARRVPVESLYRDDGLIPVALSFGEIVAQIHVPAPAGACVYRKFRIRQSFDFPLVGVAVQVRRGYDGKVQDARIVLTAVASFPERATTAENLLLGGPLDAEHIASAGQAVYRLAKPMDNTAGSIFHRKRMARVLTERALHDLAAL